MFTRNARLNFLREYRNACAGNDIQPQELVSEAATAWQALSPEEKSLFEEEQYLAARLSEAGPSALGITMGFLTAQMPDGVKEMGGNDKIIAKSTAKPKSN